MVSVVAESVSKDLPRRGSLPQAILKFRTFISYSRKLLDEMHEEKEIKIIPITVGTGEKSKELKFVCMPDILESDHRIKTYLEQQKMQIGFAPKGDENSGKVEDESINSSIKELKVRVFFKEVDGFRYLLLTLEMDS